jgi:two-component sensor histidine kinase
MKRLLTLLFFLYSLSGIAQDFGDKSYYLIDSLDLSSLSENDSVLIETNLQVYHDAGHDSSKVISLMQIIDGCSDRMIWPKYNEALNSLVLKLRDSRSLSTREKRFYERYHSVAISTFGFLEQNKGNTTRALDLYFKALKIQEEKGFKDEAVTTYLNIGGTYHLLGDSDNALKYFLKANDIQKELSGDGKLSMILNNIAVIYSDRGDFEKSLEFHLPALALREKINNKFGVAMSLNNIGGVYHSIDSSEKSIAYLKKALDLFLELDHKNWLALTYHKLGKVQFNLNLLEEAHKNGELAVKHARESQQPESMMRAATLMREISQKRGEYENALHYYQWFISVRDSLRNETTKRESIQREVQFEYDKKKELNEKETEKQLAIADSELALSDSKKERQEIISYAIGAGLILVLVFFAFVINRLRITKKQKAIIEKQNNERKLLLKEIHHRVKNNFQVISSILKLQAYEEDNEKVEVAFNDAVNRIHSMAAVHELIYKQELFTEISTEEYFNKLIDSLKSYSFKQKVSFNVKTEVSKLDVQILITLGIAINELITNSMKYAFNETIEDPKIEIELKNEQNSYTLLYKENGIGLPESQIEKTFGMELIHTIVEQIDGNIEKHSNIPWPTIIAISFER